MLNWIWQRTWKGALA